MIRQYDWQKEFTEWAYCGSPSDNAKHASDIWPQCALGEKYTLIELTTHQAWDFVQRECSNEEQVLGNNFNAAVRRNDLSVAIDIYNQIQALPKVDCDPLNYLNYLEE